MSPFLSGGVARAAVLVAAVALLVTHPLVLNMTGALPGDLGDPLLNAFILGWDASRMPHGLAGVWSAPFFFPLADTLARSEHLLGVAVIVAPIVWVTGNPILAYNLAWLASILLAGVGMYLLTRSLWGRGDAAIIGALAFAFAPHRVTHVTHLQVLMSGWMPLSLWGLHRYFSSGSRRWLVVFAGAFALLGLSNGYFLYFFSITLALVVASESARAALAGAPSHRFRFPWREAGNLSMAAAAVAAALAPAILAYARVRQASGYRREMEEMAAFSAAWSDYLRVPDGMSVWSGILAAGAGERTLFPGLTIAALAALAAVTALRSAWTAAAPKPAAWGWRLGTYATVLILALWLSAGPAAPGPYRLLLQVLPGFDGLRVPARFAVVVALALGVIGSAGAAWLFARLRPRVAAVAAGALGAAIVIEGYGGPIRMVRFEPDQPDRAGLNAWLRDGPSGGVLELPIAGPALAPFTLGYQYNTLIHGHPIVNGYSGSGYGLQDFLGGPGSPVNDVDAMPGLLDGLREIGVRYVVLHGAIYTGRRELGWPDPRPLVDAFGRAAGGPGLPLGGAVAWLLEAPRSRPPVDESALAAVPLDASMLAASAMSDRLRFALDGRIDTKWHSAAPQAGTEWIRLAFGEDLDIARVVILTSRGGVGDYPRGLLVESETGDGSRMTLYSGSFLPAMLRGLSTGEAGAPAALELPSNRTRVLWIRQTGRSAKWQWAVHELQVYRRRAPS